jgi:hypothetical protein
MNCPKCGSEMMDAILVGKDRRWIFGRQSHYYACKCGHEEKVGEKK